MTGEGKKSKPIQYGPFKILEKIGTNCFHLYLPSYMHMYWDLNIENFKLGEPPIIIDECENVQVPTIDDFASEY